MSNFTKRVYRTVGRHFVTLSCARQAPRSSEEFLVFSGFLIEVCGHWFYVTAGHILRDIRIGIEAKYTFSDWRLNDYTAGNEFEGMAVPYDFDIENWLVVEDEQSGLDYAAIPLRYMDRCGLQAGNAIPIAKGAWGDHVTEHDHWVVVGVPSRTVKYDGGTQVTAHVVVAEVVSTDEPEMAGPKAQNQFYARLKEDTEKIVEDIDGLSGGPIFALKKIDGNWTYSVIGIQSGWYPRSRVITACPFSSLAYEIERILQSKGEGAAEKAPPV